MYTASALGSGVPQGSVHEFGVLKMEDGKRGQRVEV